MQNAEWGLQNAASWAQSYCPSGAFVEAFSAGELQRTAVTLPFSPRGVILQSLASVSVAGGGGR